jgi:methyl-accepting chemotaxis protein
MTFFRDLSVRWKLLGGFGVVLALAAVMAIVLIIQIGTVNDGGTFLGRDSLPSIEQIGQMRADLIDHRLAEVRYLYEVAPSYRAQMLARLTTDERDFAAALRTNSRSVVNATDRRDSAAAAAAWRDYLAAVAPLRAVAGSGAAAGLALVHRTFGPYNALVSILRTWASNNDTWAAAQVRANASTYSSARMLGIVLLAGAVVLGLGIAVLVSETIKRRIDVVLERLSSLRDQGATDLRRGLEAMAGGDLTVEIAPSTPPIENPSGDEIGRVAQAVNGVREAFGGAMAAYSSTRAQLSDMIGKVSGSAGQVGAASQEMAGTSVEAGRATSEIADAIGGIAQGAERQVQMAEHARTVADEVARAVDEAARTAGSTAEVAGQTRVEAAQGVGSAEAADAAMRSVRESSAAVTAAIDQLAKKSGQIGEIVQTIAGIAEQTNLLALNAAIEAARAGEQGRGFAVVAEEVRKLAEESQAAAEQIALLIGAIQDETAHAVDVVQDGTRRTEEGASVVERTREAFVRIGSSVDDMTSRIEQIAAVSEEISASVTDLQQSIGEVAAVAEQSSASTEQVSASTEQTSASAQQIAASAQELAGSAETLNALVAQFRIA